MRSLLLLLCVMLFSTANAGVLGDIFNKYSSQDCISTQDVKSQMPEAIVAKLSIPTPNSGMMTKYPSAINSFLKSLPQSNRMNKGKLEEGEPEIYFSQPSATSNAEVIIMANSDGIYMVTYFLLPPKAGKEFKDDIVKTLSK